MAKINFNECYKLIDKLSKSVDGGLCVGKLTSRLIRLTLNEYFREISLYDMPINLYEHVANIFSEYNVEAKVAHDVYEELQDMVYDKLKPYSRDYTLPIRFHSNVLIIPYREHAPNNSTMSRVKARYIIQLTPYTEILEKNLQIYDRFDRRSFMDVACDYVKYMFMQYFDGFKKDEVIHPLEPYFGKEELIELAKDNDDEDDDYENTSIEDIILNTFSKLEKEMDTLFNTMLVNLELNPHDIVYVYMDTTKNVFSIYHDSKNLMETFYREVFDHKTCGVNAAGGRLNGYCEYHQL